MSLADAEDYNCVHPHSRLGYRSPREYIVAQPATIRVDQGIEFVSRDLDLWAYQRGVTLDFSRPGKPTDTMLYNRSTCHEASFSTDFGLLVNWLLRCRRSKARKNILRKTDASGRAEVIARYLRAGRAR